MATGQGASNHRNPPLHDGDTVIVNRSGLAVANVFALIKLLNNN
jgi:uncharacterized integral membrane protein